MENLAFQLSDPVREALGRNDAVVALESTVLTHGLPGPRNLQAARRQESAVVEAGATAATIAIWKGRILVGMTEAERAALCGGTAQKVPALRIPLAIAREANGGTTVGATAAIARLAGIQVMSTGGIGGVHPGGTDVSSDLWELARTPIILVCAGPKIILDVRATREALETLSIPVLGWGTAELPAFLTERSGLSVDERVDSAEEVAAIWTGHRAIDRPGAIVVCVPPPSPIGPDRLEEWIAECGDAPGDQTGAARTPHLLEHLHRRSHGETVDANVALLEENARVAGLIASAVAS